MKKLLFALCFLTAFAPLQKEEVSVFYRGKVLKTIVIDAGHGGKDPGTLGKSCYEKNIALDVALRLGKLIETHLPHIKVVYTRKDDTFIPLRERTRIANRAGADLFISVHCNAHPLSSISGTETYIMGPSSSKGNLEVAMRENAVIMQEANYLDHYEGFDPNSSVSHILLSNLQSNHLAQSLQLATQIEDAFRQRAQRESHGVKQSGFLVLAKTGMPSVLVEIGFLSNREEEKFLNSELGRATIAASLYRAVRDYRKRVEGVGW